MPTPEILGKDDMTNNPDIDLRYLDVSDKARFADRSIFSVFALLREKDPVHFCENSPNGPYWSIVRFADIANVEADTKRFSSASGFTFADIDPNFHYRSVMASDGHQHRQKRTAISPMMTLEGLQKLELYIRAAVKEILDSLTVGETFDWVDKVSMALTSRMLAIMMGMPSSDCGQLLKWTAIAATIPGKGELFETFEEQDALLDECYRYFLDLRAEKIGKPPEFNFISMLAHSDATASMDIQEFLLTIIVLLVGGNETTRNTISGSALFLDENPDQKIRFYTDPDVMKSGISEILRFQTPVAYMRRTATVDVLIGGKTIRKGDKVILWYLSGNRDPDAIPDPEKFIVDRPYAGRHLSFGFGPHRCIGRHLAEMQLKILWEEIIRRNWLVKPTGRLVRTDSNFVNGYNSLEVILQNELDSV